MMGWKKIQTERPPVGEPFLIAFLDDENYADACFATMDKVGLIYLSDSPSKQRGTRELCDIEELENSKDKIYWSYFSFPRGLKNYAR